MAPAPKEGKGWMPPRGGGYRPGKNTAQVSANDRKPAPKPPHGGAGIGKLKAGRGDGR